MHYWCRQLTPEEGKPIDKALDCCERIKYLKYIIGNRTHGDRK